MEAGSSRIDRTFAYTVTARLCAGLRGLRVTWITLALAAGVPRELVQRVTGHRTVEVVMKHHFRPGREDSIIAMHQYR